MYSRQSSARSRVHATRQKGIKEENIDRQILVLHEAMGKKLLRDPGLVPGVLNKIEQRYAEGRLRHGAYLTWITLMELLDNEALFLQSLLENSPQMRRLRRRTPMVGILTEEERQAALNRFACGETSPDVMF